MPVVDDLPHAFNADEAARYLALSPRSIRDRGWRLKVGLLGFRCGRALRFARADLDAFIRRNRERPTRVLVAEPGCGEEAQ